MKEPISIKEIMAIVIKRGAAVICVAIALAALLGGIQGGKALADARDPENTKDKVDARNQRTLANYEEERALAQFRIDSTNKSLKEAQDYNQNALLMQLDPSNYYRCHVLLSVVAEEDLDQSYELKGKVVDYVTTRVQNQYISYWNNMDMSKTLEENPYADIHERYIRSILTLETVEDGQLFLIAKTPDAETAYALCQSAYQALVEAYDTVAEASYPHELVLVNTETKMGVDGKVSRDQADCLKAELELRETLSKAKQTMRNISKPSVEGYYSVSGAVGTAVKWAVIGGVVGFVLACACVWLFYIVSDGVETTRQMEAILRVPFFGSAAKKGSPFVRLANWLVGERSWKDRERAVQYIAENLKSRQAEPSQIAVLSTLAVSQEDAGIAMVLKAAQQLGHKVTFVGEAEQDPAAIAALRESSHVILAERLGASNRNAMLGVLESAKQLDAKVLGFFTI